MDLYASAKKLEISQLPNWAANVIEIFPEFSRVEFDMDMQRLSVFATSEGFQGGLRMEVSPIEGSFRAEINALDYTYVKIGVAVCATFLEGDLYGGVKSLWEQFMLRKALNWLQNLKGGSGDLEKVIRTLELLRVDISSREDRAKR